MHWKTFLSTILLILSFFIILSAQEITTNWPAFRGSNANGLAENSSLPNTWDVESSKNIQWKISLPGLALSSPVIWQDKIFITTAVNTNRKAELKVGLYGDIDPVEDESIHEWKIMCFDKSNGSLLWEKTSHTGIPKVKRHPKSSHANCTPATNGTYVIVFFGSEGLYCYTTEGKLVWKKDLGLLDSGFFKVPEAQWGFASSPVIHDESVIIQCDVQENSFLASFDIITGKENWRTLRDEVPTWSTPTIQKSPGNPQIIVNGFKHIGGYDFTTGEEIWKMSGGGDIPVPTPVVAHDLIFINNAHGKMSPIYAIRYDAKGDISLHGEDTSNKYIAWSERRGGSYMLTPLILGNYLYNCRMNGSLRCHNAKTGELIYKEKITGPLSSSAVATKDKIYFTSEKGEVSVIKAGPEFKLLSQNSLNDLCMATPAISDDTIYFRTRKYLIAISE